MKNKFKFPPTQDVVEPEPGVQLVSMGTENTEVTFTKEKRAFLKILRSCWGKCFGRKKKG